MSLSPHKVPGHPTFSAEVVDECCPLVVPGVEDVLLNQDGWVPGGSGLGPW